MDPRGIQDIATGPLESLNPQAIPLYGMVVDFQMKFDVKRFYAASMI